LNRVLSIGPVSTKIFGITFIVLISLFYLAQSSQSATRSYAISDLENRKEQIDQGKDELAVEAMRLKSLQSIQSKAEELGLEPE